MKRSHYCATTAHDLSASPDAHRRPVIQALAVRLCAKVLKRQPRFVLSSGIEVVRSGSLGLWFGVYPRLQYPIPMTSSDAGDGRA
jgi:hypothetical protein